MRTPVHGAVRADVEASLERLGVDRLDAVQVHDPDPDTPIEDTWEALMALVDEGLVAAAGLSNHSIPMMERALAVGPIAVVQHQYSLLAGEPDGVIQWCHERGIPFLAWSPLASGFLADSFDVGSLDPDDLRRRLRWATTDVERVARVRDVTRAGRRPTRGDDGRRGAGVDDTPSGVHAIVGARTPAETEIVTAPLPTLADDDLRLLDEAAGGPG